MLIGLSPYFSQFEPWLVALVLFIVTFCPVGLRMSSLFRKCNAADRLPAAMQANPLLFPLLPIKYFPKRLDAKWRSLLLSQSIFVFQTGVFTLVCGYYYLEHARERLANGKGFTTTRILIPVIEFLGLPGLRMVIVLCGASLLWWSLRMFLELRSRSHSTS